MSTTPTTPVLTADDIPMEFTLEGLRQHFSDEEILAMNEGDDPILPGVDLSQPTPEGQEALPEGEDPSAIGEEPAPVEPAPVVADTAPDPERPVPVDVSTPAATVAALDAKLATLQEQYDDGDLTSAEWRAQLSAMVKEQAAAQAALTLAQEQMASLAPKAEAYKSAWVEKVTAYQNQHAYLGSDAHWDNWDAALKMVNTNGAYAALSMSQRIEQAHRIYAAHYEGLEGKPLPTRPGLTTQQKADAKAAQTGPRQDPRPEAPTTLADLTNAADNGVEDGRFAQIDRIADTDPVRAEAMVAALSDSDRIAYLNV